MNKEIITFDVNKIEKCKSHCYKNSIFLKNIDIDNIQISV